MIEGLEAEAVAKLGVAVGKRGRVEASGAHQGFAIDVLARRRKDGTVVFGYRYGGVRLEKSVLLTLICPQQGCEPGQRVKREWAARNPLPPERQRCARGWQTLSLSGSWAPLFEEVELRRCIARPASFAVVSACPVGVHQPAVVHLQGWDVFRDGKCIAGGLVSDRLGAKAARFPSLASIESWVAHDAEDAQP